MIDQTSNTLVETMNSDSMVNDKSSQDETTIEHSPINSESTEMDNRSSLSLVDLVETIFKPIESIDQIAKSINEESTTIDQSMNSS